MLRMAGISPDYEEWVISSPPEPSDIQWHDLTQDPTAQSGRTLIGYALVAGLYFAYLPCVIGITNIAQLINMGPLQSLWQGVAPTLGLQVMVAFLPTLLILVFQSLLGAKALFPGLEHRSSRTHTCVSHTSFLHLLWYNGEKQRNCLRQ